MEHLLAKEGVAGSIPVSRSFYLVAEALFYGVSAVVIYSQMEKLPRKFIMKQDFAM